MKSLKDKSAEVISFLFSPPLVLGAFFVFLTFYFADDCYTAFLWLLVALIFLVLLPSAYILRQFRQGKISDWHLENREERLLPFIFTLGATLVATIIFYFLSTARPILAFLVAGIFAASALTLITIFWKISAHTSTLAGIVTAVVLFTGGSWWWLYVLLIPIIWARMARQRHTLAQLFAGAILSVLIVGGTLWMLGYGI